MADMPREVQEAYERARRRQPAHYEALPEWETLSLGLREAFIYVFYMGRMNGMREVRDALPRDWPSQRAVDAGVFDEGMKMTNSDPTLKSIRAAYYEAGRVPAPPTTHRYRPGKTKSGALEIGGSGSGRWGSRRPIAEGLQRFDLAEYMRRPDAVKPYAGCIATISNGKLSAQIRYTETTTQFGGRRLWMLCPRCSRRCRVVFLGFGRVACRRCFRVRYHSQSLDQIGRAQHAMRKIAKQLDPEVDMDLPDSPDRPLGMHWSRYNRLAERF
jgi:hypothetical protein